jgi:HEAT repeat protein
MAAYVLGVIKDPRSLDALHVAATGGAERLRFEAATSMLRMDDRRGLPPMIDGLESPDALVRARAILVLEENTGATMGYRADDRPADRAAAVARWRAWLRESGPGGGP